VLAPGRTAAVVNGWDYSSLNAFFDRLRSWLKRSKGVARTANTLPEENVLGRGTFVRKNGPTELRLALKPYFPIKILVWRSAGTNFLRFFIREGWFGHFWLRLLYFLEETFPRFFGENGRYPLVVFSK
jgi:hypothetical protein